MKNATQDRQQCLNILGSYVSGCFLLTEFEYLPIYLECLYPYLSNSVCGAQYGYGMEITSLRTNHQLFYSVLYLNHGELVCISDHVISVSTCIQTHKVIKRPWSSRLVPPTFPRSLLLILCILRSTCGYYCTEVRVLQH